MPGTRDDVPDPPREITVRPTRDGDHVLITINIGMFEIKIMRLLASILVYAGTFI